MVRDHPDRKGDVGVRDVQGLGHPFVHVVHAGHEFLVHGEHVAVRLALRLRLFGVAGKPRVHLFDFGTLGGDDRFGELAHFGVLAVLEFDFGHFNGTLVVRHHARGKGGVRVEEHHARVHVGVHAVHPGREFRLHRGAFDLVRAVVHHFVIHRTVVHPGVRIGRESAARSESETGTEKRDGERGKGAHGVGSFL